MAIVRKVLPSKTLPLLSGTFIPFLLFISVISLSMRTSHAFRSLLLPSYYHRQQQQASSSIRKCLVTSKAGKDTTLDEYEDWLDSDKVYEQPVVQWYPGHIAKAERQLQETIKAVDVVLEVRDARIPLATQHPSVPTWCAGKPRIAVITHQDVVPRFALHTWKHAIQEEDHNAILDKQIQHQALQVRRERMKYEPGLTEEEAAKTIVCCVNAKQGEGIRALKRAIQKAGQHVHTRREMRGMIARPLRVGVLGYPNTGKSALINKIVHRKRAKTANTPGVTRSLQWIRIKGDTDFELLDSPGIIPAILANQKYAKLLAMCNCIGQNAYDQQMIAAFCCEHLYNMEEPQIYAPSWHKLFEQRYDVKPGGSGEQMLYAVADSKCLGCPEDAARKILQDFRTGRMGAICLQVAPTIDRPETETEEQMVANEEEKQEELLKRQMIAKKAKEAAQDRGVVLPEIGDTKEVGKGLFEGW